MEVDTSQDECTAVPGVGNADSPHCQEVRLFRSWHEAAEEDAGLLHSTESSNAALNDELDASSGAPIAVELSSHVTTLLSSHVSEFGHQDSNPGTPPLLEPAQDKNNKLMDELESKIRASLNASSD